MEELKIVLVGYMGSGKTTLGRMVANHLKINFLDLDAYIEEKENKTVASIFKDRGEVFFRKKEHEYLSEILSKNEPFVLSVGGGTPCFGTNMQLISQSTVNSFYIQVSIEELCERLINQKDQRPLIAHLTKGELPEFIAKHLFERSFFYNQARYTLKSKGRPPSVLADIIMEALV